MATRRYQQRARAATAEDTRRAILDAVYQRLRDAPSEQVSVEHVARMAGVARSTVYVIFGSRAGLFDALGADLLQRAGFERIAAAVALPDARDQLHDGLVATVDVYAANRDVARALYSMALLDPDAVGRAIHRIEENRAGGMAHLAQRLADQGVLRPDITAAEAADILWVRYSFDTFDLLTPGAGSRPTRCRSDCSPRSTGPSAARRRSRRVSRRTSSSSSRIGRSIVARQTCPARETTVPQIGRLR